jgi:intracellular multiplication protein IcmP
MPGAAPQGGGQGDNSTALLWMTTAFLATLGGLWFGFHNQIVSFYFMFKIYEVDMINYIGGYLHFNTDTLSSLRLAMESARDNPTNVQFTDVMTAGNMVGRVLRIPLVVILVICAILVFVSSTTRVFKRTYSMRDLAKEEKNNWPQITPVVDLDLIKTDIDTGPWAMAMTPVQFCKKFRLLDEVKPQRQEGMHRRDWDRIEVVLKRGEANKLFALQLGPLWRGTQNLPPHARALFAAFAARINADTAPAAKLLAQLSVSCMSKQLNMEGVDELLKKHENTKLVQQKMQSHAYVTTVMATMLAGAREDGVQASSDFLWLKPLDRRLWYTLNTVGRQTPFVEVAGVFAHWVAEKEAGRKLVVPMVEEATNAVELALKEVVYKRDEK